MKRVLASVIALLVVAYAGLVLWSLHTADIEDVSLCVTEDNTHRIPNSVCEWYLFQFRGTPSDIEYLKNRAGIAFFFGVENHEMRQRLISFFLKNGLSINQHSVISGYPPLHGAILMNDPKLVELLLEKGADPAVEDRNKGLTARKLLAVIEERNPDQDLSGIEARLDQE